MTEKTLKSYQETGIRLQFVQIEYDDLHLEFELRLNRKKIYHGNAVAFDYCLKLFRNEVYKLINQTKLF